MTPNRLLLIACGLAGACAQPAAAQTVSPMEVVILRPTALANTQDLDFGTIASGATAGEVQIDPGDDMGPAVQPRAVSGGVTPAGGSPRAAAFRAYGSKKAQVTLELDKTDTVLTRVGGTDTMTVVDLTLNDAAKGKRRKKAGEVGKDGYIDFRVGGTLQVAAGQPGGTYRGRFTVTAIYN